MVNVERFPEVRRRDLSYVVERAVGQPVDVVTHETDDQGRPVAASLSQLTAKATGDVLEQLGLSGDETLRLICSAVARAAVGDLVTGDGFDINYGRFPDYNRRVRVELAGPEPPIVQASVIQQVGEQ
jgi:hypothetical protein